MSLVLLEWTPRELVGTLSVYNTHTDKYKNTDVCARMS